MAVTGALGAKFAALHRRVGFAVWNHLLKTSSAIRIATQRRNRRFNLIVNNRASDGARLRLSASHMD